MDEVSQKKLKDICEDLERARSYCDASYINIQEAYMALQEVKTFFNQSKEK